MKVEAQELDPRRHPKVKLRTFGEVDLIQVVKNTQSEFVVDLVGESERAHTSVKVTLKSYGELYPRGLEWNKTYECHDLVEVIDAAG